jgi:hypothetical protein
MAAEEISSVTAAMNYKASLHVFFWLCRGERLPGAEVYEPQPGRQHPSSYCPSPGVPTYSVWPKAFSPPQPESKFTFRPLLMLTCQDSCSRSCPLP